MGLVFTEGPPAVTGPVVDPAAIEPSFYTLSHVYGHPNPTRTATDIFNREVVIDLGAPQRGGVSTQDVTIQLAVHTKDCTEGVDFTIHWPVTPGEITIPAGQPQVKLRIELHPTGRVGNQKLFALEMTSSTHGHVDGLTLDRRNWYYGVILGTLDERGLIPPLTTPPDDFRVYADRIEDLVNGITIPLPFNANALPAFYDHIKPRINFGAGDELLDGPGIAATLAEMVWKSRNGGSLGTVVRRDGGPINSAADLGTGAVRFIGTIPTNFEGVPVCVRVMEQPAISVGLKFGGTNSRNGSNARPNYIQWGDADEAGGPGGPLFGPSVVRDLWIVADDPSIRLRGIAFDQKKKTETSLIIDNVHVKDFTIDPAPTRDVVGSSGIRHLQADMPGIRYLDGLTFLEPTTFQSDGGANKQSIRLNGFGSLDVRNCTNGAPKEHFVYVDQKGPILRLYNNVSPPSKTGRTQILQHVQRPDLQGGSAVIGGPGHGLCAIVECEAGGRTGFEGPNDSGAPDISIVGFLGSVFIVGTRHTGGLEVQGQRRQTRSGSGQIQTHRVAYNRRPLGIVATGNESGIYAIDDVRGGTPASGEPPYALYTVDYVWIDDLRIQLDVATAGPTPLLWDPDGNVIETSSGPVPFVWNADGCGLSGIHTCEIGGVARYTGPTLGSRPAWSFNDSVKPRVHESAGVTDPLRRTIADLGPNGEQIGLGTACRTPNRGDVFGGAPGGFRVHGGVFASILGPPFGTSAGGLPGSGSGTYARHYRFDEVFAAGNSDGTKFSDLSPAQRNAYDGRDPN